MKTKITSGKRSPESEKKPATTSRKKKVSNDEN